MRDSPDRYYDVDQASQLNGVFRLRTDGSVSGDDRTFANRPFSEIAEAVIQPDADNVIAVNINNLDRRRRWVG